MGDAFLVKNIRSLLRPNFIEMDGKFEVTEEKRIGKAACNGISELGRKVQSTIVLPLLKFSSILHAVFASCIYRRAFFSLHIVSYISCFLLLFLCVAKRAAAHLK